MTLPQLHLRMPLPLGEFFFLLSLIWFVSFIRNMTYWRHESASYEHGPIQPRSLDSDGINPYAGEDPLYKSFIDVPALGSTSGGTQYLTPTGLASFEKAVEPIKYVSPVTSSLATYEANDFMLDIAGNERHINVGLVPQSTCGSSDGSHVTHAAHAFTAPAMAVINNQGLIVCPNVDSIPPGRQASKILKCGIAGCTAAKLFDRKYELQHHMQGHAGKIYTCLEPGCPCRGDNAFARADKLGEHVRKAHGK